eukprot:5982733-Pleurochrysis_carterae.AAC.1
MVHLHSTASAPSRENSSRVTHCSESSPSKPAKRAPPCHTRSARPSSAITPTRGPSIPSEVHRVAFRSAASRAGKPLACVVPPASTTLRAQGEQGPRTAACTSSRPHAHELSPCMPTCISASAGSNAHARLHAVVQPCIYGRNHARAWDDAA